MDNNGSEQTANSYPQSFDIKRRTPGARAKLIIGRIAIVVSFLLIAVFVAIVSSGAAGEGVAFIPLGIAAPVIITGIVLCASSNNSMNGTMTFLKDKAIYQCGDERFEILPDKITAAHRSYEKVLIVFSGIKLRIVSEQAPEIMHCLDIMVNPSDRSEAEEAPDEGEEAAGIEVPAESEDADAEAAAESERSDELEKFAVRGETAEPEKPVDAADRDEPTITERAALIDPNILREYKKLVDEGVLTQEQFDEIVRKNT